MMRFDINEIKSWIKITVPHLLKKHSVPGAAVAVFVNGEVVFKCGCGVQCSGENNPIDERTAFEGASLTKPVFSYGVLRLARDGKLDLDRPISDYLEKPYIKGDERINKITARMVLSHTSGLPNWRPNFWTSSDSGIEISKSPGSLKTQSEPGSRFKYSAEGFNYLQAAVEQVTNDRIDHFIKNCVLDPLGMSRSSFVWMEDFESSSALPHNDKGLMVHKWQWRPQEPLAAGSFFTTAADYARFFCATLVTEEKPHSDENRLPARYLESVLQPQIKIQKNFAWSLIWGIEQHENESFFLQWGDNQGIKHFAVCSSTKRVGVVVLTNGQNGQRVCRPVVEKILGSKLDAFDNI
jgi:CubicO group peptidase (beta-lactamase class C family)